MSVASPLSSGLLLIAALAVAAPAAAQTATSTFSANLGGIAKLSLSSTTLAFPDADPDTVPLILPQVARSRSPPRHEPVSLPP